MVSVGKLLGKPERSHSEPACEGQVITYSLPTVMAGGPNMRKGFLRHWFAVEVSNFARARGIS